MMTQDEFLTACLKSIYENCRVRLYGFNQAKVSVEEVLRFQWLEQVDDQARNRAQQQVLNYLRNSRPETQIATIATIATIEAKPE